MPRLKYQILIAFGCDITEELLKGLLNPIIANSASTIVILVYFLYISQGAQTLQPMWA